MAFRIEGYCPGHVQDIPALEAVWADFVHRLDELAGQPFEGFVAGGDWVGDDRSQADAFKLTAAEVRAAGKWPK
jgi:hypothetical protein